MAAQIAATEGFTTTAGATFSGMGRTVAQPGVTSDRRRKELAAARAALLGGRSHAESAARIAVTRAVRDAFDTSDAFKITDVPGTEPRRGAAEVRTNAVNPSEVWAWTTQER